MDRTYRKRRIWPIALIITLALFILAAALGYTLLRSMFPLHYAELVFEHCERTGLQPALVMAVIKAESGFDPDAVSRADAYGLMQLTGETLEWLMMKAGELELGYTTDDLLRPDINIKYGTDMLMRMCDEFATLDVALAAYNAGRGRVNGWLADPRYSDDGAALGSIPYKETADYVKKVQTYKDIYEFLYSELKQG